MGPITGVGNGYNPFTATTGGKSATDANAVTSGAATSGSSAVQAPDLNAGQPSFSDTLQSALSNVNNLQINANDLAQQYAQGQGGDIHTVMIASEQATIALQLTTQVRNKAIDAYQTIMQMTM